MKHELVIAVALAVAACSGNHRGERATPAPAPATSHVVAPEPLPLPVPPREAEPSIYDLELTFRGADGGEVALDVGRGQPTLISMFYGSCSTACPALIGYMKQVAREAGPDTRVLLVSFDPARDTPEKLSQLMATYKLDERWTLAAADDASSRTLAAVLGIKYRPVESGEFFHNSVIVALDRDGSPVARMNGLGDYRELVSALTR